MQTRIKNAQLELVVTCMPGLWLQSNKENIGRLKFKQSIGSTGKKFIIICMLSLDELNRPQCTLLYRGALISPKCCLEKISWCQIHSWSESHTVMAELQCKASSCCIVPKADIIISFIHKFGS